MQNEFEVRLTNEIIALIKIEGKFQSCHKYVNVIDNFIIPVNYVKTCSEMLPCDPSFRRVPWDARVRRGKMSPDT